MTRLLAAAFTVLLALAGPGCGGRDDASNPEAAVRSLIGAARAGDRAAVYARFGPRTRGDGFWSGVAVGGALGFLYAVIRR